jgi:hypothetical protein
MKETVRETNDGRMAPVKLAGDFDGLTRRVALKGLLERHDDEIYQALKPKPKRRWLRRPLPVTQIAAALALQVLAWTGVPQKPQEAAAILAMGNHWSNVSPVAAPLPEGIVGTPLPSIGYIYWRGVVWTWRVGSYPAWGHGRGYRGGRGRR